MLDILIKTYGAGDAWVSTDVDKKRGGAGAHGKIWSYARKREVRCNAKTRWLDRLWFSCLTRTRMQGAERHGAGHKLWGHGPRSKGVGGIFPVRMKLVVGRSSTISSLQSPLSKVKHHCYFAPTPRWLYNPLTRRGYKSHPSEMKKFNSVLGRRTSQENIAMHVFTLFLKNHSVPEPNTTLPAYIKSMPLRSLSLLFGTKVQSHYPSILGYILYVWAEQELERVVKGSKQS